MKKFLIIVFALVILSGCASNKKILTTSQATPSDPQKAEDMVNNLEKEVNNLETGDNKINMERQIATIKTNKGDIKVELFNDKSPKTVKNFVDLANKDFYDGILFHRVISDFMIQAGDPNTKTDPKNWATHGTGGPGYKFEDEFNDVPLVAGSLAMANAGPNTNGSQFFIVTAASTPWLDGRHTNFGQVVEGMDVVLEIQNVDTNESDHPLKDVVIKDIEIE